MLGLRGKATADDHDIGNEVIQVQRTVHVLKSEVESQLHEARGEISQLSQRMADFEKRLANDIEEQQWWLHGVIVVLSVVILLIQVPGMQWLFNTIAVIIIIHALVILGVSPL